jgi:hypothetical protein
MKEKQKVEWRNGYEKKRKKRKGKKGRDTEAVVRESDRDD